MKIGIVAPSSLPVPAVYGGAVETLIDNILIENERVLLHDIIVFSEHDKKARELSRKYLKTKFIWLNGNTFYKILDLIFRVLKRLRIIKNYYQFFFVNYYVKKYRLDLIMVEGIAIYIKYLKKKININKKLLFHIHARLIEAENPQLIDALEISDRIIVVSDFIKSDLLNRFTLDPNKIVVLRNCISHSFLNKEIFENDKIALKEELKIDAKDFVLIFTGRLVPEKGLLELVRASKLLIKLINLKLLILGSFGSDFGRTDYKRNYFQEIVCNEILGLEDHFIFCRYVPNALMPGYYAIADVAVVPSLCYDAAPLVPIEAMSAALPVIYSNKGGMKEYVTPQCGIMIDMDVVDPVEKIVEAIKILYEDIELRKKMSAASLNRAMQFTPGAYFENLNKIFTDETFITKMDSNDQ